MVRCEEYNAPYEVFAYVCPSEVLAYDKAANHTVVVSVRANLMKSDNEAGSAALRNRGHTQLFTNFMDCGNKEFNRSASA